MVFGPFGAEMYPFGQPIMTGKVSLGWELATTFGEPILLPAWTATVHAEAHQVLVPKPQNIIAKGNALENSGI